MSDYISRMEEERDELKDKTRKCKYFTQGKNFGSLDEQDKDLHMLQLNAMQEYLSILTQRIDRAKGV